MPGWCPELAKIPGMDNHKELAWKVQASFKLPWWISEWHGMENYHQAPPMLLCICQKDFLSQPDPKSTCQDIRESELEKMVAYAQALQFWAEKTDLSTQGQPCLLVGSILELWEAMACYISFPDDAFFCGMAHPEEPLITQSEETTPKSSQPTSTNSSIKEAAVKVAKREAAPEVRPADGSNTFQKPNEEPTRREQSPNWFPGWKEMLHPPGQSLLASRSLPSLKVPSRDLIVEVLGRGWLAAKGQMKS